MPPAPPPTTPALSDTRHNAVEAVTWPVRGAAAWRGRLILVVAALYLLGRGLSYIGIVVFAFIIALFLTAILHPVEVRMRALPGRRSLHSLLALLVGIIAVGGLGWFVAWQGNNPKQKPGDPAPPGGQKT